MSIAMRMPAVTHRPLELVIDRAREKSRRRSAWHRLGWTGIEALVFLGFLIVIAGVGPQVWRWGALEQHMDVLLQDPSLTHPLGTDEFGRDILARLLMGARWSLAGAAIICAGTSLLGFFIAALAVSGNRKTATTPPPPTHAMMALPGLVTAL